MGPHSTALAARNGHGTRDGRVAIPTGAGIWLHRARSQELLPGGCTRAIPRSLVNRFSASPPPEQRPGESGAHVPMSTENVGVCTRSPLVH